MLVRQIMRRQVHTVAAHATVLDAAQRMRDAHVGCLVVAEDQVLGIVTDRDLTVRCLAQGHNPVWCRIDQHMTTPVVTVEPDTDILDAARTMVEHKVKRLPVVALGRLAGLLSLTDIALAMDRPVHNLLMGMGATRRAA